MYKAATSIPLERRIVPYRLPNLPKFTPRTRQAHALKAYPAAYTNSDPTIQPIHHDFVMQWSRRWQTTDQIADRHRNIVGASLQPSASGEVDIAKAVHTAWYASCYHMLEKDLPNAKVALFKPSRLRQPLVRTPRPRRGRLNKHEMPERDFVWEVWAKKEDLEKLPYWGALKQLLEIIGDEALGDANYLIHFDPYEQEYSFRIPTPNLLETIEGHGTMQPQRHLANAYFGTWAKNEDYANLSVHGLWPVSFPTTYEKVHGYDNVPAAVMALHDIWHKSRFEKADVSAQYLSQVPLLSALEVVGNDELRNSFSERVKQVIRESIEFFRELKFIETLDDFFVAIRDFVFKMIDRESLDSLKEVLSYLRINIDLASKLLKKWPVEQSDVLKFMERLRFLENLTHAKMEILAMDA